MASCDPLMAMQVYADWASCNQRKLAISRLGNALSLICSKKFLEYIKKVNNKFDIVFKPWLDEMLVLEKLPRDNTTKIRKRNLMVKYFGEDITSSFESDMSVDRSPVKVFNSMTVWIIFYRK